jgi:predicted TIM-barrel fold metal-dependent hydrolase
MHKIPIFDSLTHPTSCGDWLNGKDYNNVVNNLLNQMKENKIKWAFCVEMPNVNKFRKFEYRDLVKEHDNLYPVYFFDDYNKIKSKIKHIKDNGYIGIKIHPRLSKISIANDKIKQVIKEASKYNLITFLCTYFYDDSNISIENNIGSLRKLLSKVNAAKIILLHGGTIHLLELMEIVKPYDNVMLDLSYTLCKYKGSSLDLDIAYVFKNFDRRICIGSDSPEITLKELRERYEYFSKDLNIDKKNNIAFKNIKNFIGK